MKSIIRILVIAVAFATASPVLAQGQQGGLPAVLAELQNLQSSTNAALTNLMTEIQELHDQVLIDAAAIGTLEAQVAALGAGGGSVLSAGISASTYYVSTAGQFIQFDTVYATRGSNIAINTSTGVFTLQPGLYEVNVNFQMFLTTRDGVVIDLIDESTSSQVAGSEMVINDQKSDSDFATTSARTVVLTVTAPTSFHFRHAAASLTGGIYGPTARLNIKQL